MATSALVATSQTTTLNKMTSPPFIVKNGKSRFNEATIIGDKSANDIKVSSTDTQGNLI